MTKKPKAKFYGAAKRYLKQGLPIDDIYSLQHEFDITTEEIDAFKETIPKSNLIEGLAAPDKELQAKYEKLDSLFVAYHPDMVIFRRGENSYFFEYKEGVYMPITDTEMEDKVDGFMAMNFLFDYRTSNRNIKDTVLRVERLLSRTPHRSFTEEYIQTKFYLNLKNGLLDLKTFTLLPHTKEYFSTVQVPYVYDPSAPSPKFDNFISKVSEGKKPIADMIQEMFGYCLGEGNPKHKIFYLYGETARNGKSTTAKILCGLLGWGNISTLSLEQIASESSSVLTSIIGKQLNFSDEISNKYVDSGRLAAMVAEGVVEINPKFKATFLYKVRTKFIVTCNDLPRFENSQAMKNRAITLPFRYYIEPDERVERYEEYLLDNEGSGILNFAIEGAKKLALTGAFTISEESLEDMHDNLMSSNPVYAYLEEDYTKDSTCEDRVLAKVIYGTPKDGDKAATGFRRFCIETGIGTMSLQKFAKEMSRYAREFKIERVKSGDVIYYKGLKIKT